jgi:hypothetical protein
MSDASQEDYEEDDDSTICQECGARLDKDELESGRNICFDCYVLLQG